MQFCFCSLQQITKDLGIKKKGITNTNFKASSDKRKYSVLLQQQPKTSQSVTNLKSKLEAIFTRDILFYKVLIDTCIYFRKNYLLSISKDRRVCRI
ncbi:unnamed protein product [Paramecium octaurelia]|uniref:Uncharacterized protein n=1 Tax=Paramecium octaurelia TaxID=43137 RepID=A0A8S1WU56_PAROT|nr:unnamed protein product [Paramecium octaurelia]